jgi:hypothetical protein
MKQVIYLFWRAKIMDRRLEFYYPAIIDAYSGVAGNISVQQYYNSYIPLIISNHFLITYYHDSKSTGFNWRFYNDDFGHFIDIHDLVEAKGIIEALIDVINHGYYIHLVIDHYFISQSDAYNNYHNFHDCATIFGYNTDKEIFYVADNFINGKFEIFEISYDEIIKSREECNDRVIEKFYFNSNIHFELTLYKIQSLVHGYVYGTYYYEVNNKFIEIDKNQNEVFGIFVYDILYKQAVDTINKNNRYDVRSFHVMYNHMNIGILLMQWLIDSNTDFGELINKKKYIEIYQVLSNKMLTARNLYIKLSTFFSSNSYNKLLKLIEEIKLEEYKLLNDLKQDLEDEIGKTNVSDE